MAIYHIYKKIGLTDNTFEYTKQKNSPIVLSTNRYCYSTLKSSSVCLIINYSDFVTDYQPIQLANATIYDGLIAFHTYKLYG